MLGFDHPQEFFTFFVKQLRVLFFLQQNESCPGWKGGGGELVVGEDGVVVGEVGRVVGGWWVKMNWWWVKWEGWWVKMGWWEVVGEDGGGWSRQVF